MKLRKKSGFSLVELLTVIAIIGIIVTVTPVLFIKAYQFIRLSVVRYELQRDGRTAMEVLSRRLRKARANSLLIDQLGPAADPANLLPNGSVQQPPYSRIRFQQVLSSATASATDTYVWFWQDGTDLWEGSGPGSIPYPPTSGSAEPLKARRLIRTLENVQFSMEGSSDQAERVVAMNVRVSQSAYGGTKRTYQLHAEKVRLMN